MPLFVYARGVSRIEPAIGSYHGRRGLRIIPVTQHDVGAAYHQRSLVANLDFNAGYRFSDTSRQIVVSGIRARHGTGFGQTVTLYDWQPQADEYTGNLSRQRRSPDNRNVESPPQPGHDLVGHQRLKHRPQEKRKLP